MKKPLILAKKIARSLGMPETWPNLQTIRLAIECEASFSGVSPEDAAEVILKAAKEFVPGPQHSRPSEWVRRELWRANVVDRFWFEDTRWRGKNVYTEFRSRMEVA